MFSNVRSKLHTNLDTDYNVTFIPTHFSGGKECEGNLRYYPFRMTPYLMKVQDTVHAEDQFCCLLLAERVHSGYDGKNLSANKGSQFNVPSKKKKTHKSRK